MYPLLPGLWVSGESRKLGIIAVVSQGLSSKEGNYIWETVLMLAVPEYLTLPETDYGSEGGLQLEEDW